jgi:hypothetical protein
VSELFRAKHRHKQIDKKHKSNRANQYVLNHDSKPPAGIGVNNAHDEKSDRGGNKKKVLHNCLSVFARVYPKPTRLVKTIDQSHHLSWQNPGQIRSTSTQQPEMRGSH